MAQENLLPQLYTYASSLTPIELEAMLNEDPEHMQKRAAAQLAVRVRRPRPCIPIPSSRPTARDAADRISTVVQLSGMAGCTCTAHTQNVQ